VDRKGFFNKGALGQVTAIFFIQASSAIAFAVFFSGLSIYLTENKNFPQGTASLITGLFLSLNYFLPLIGGFIANRYMSYKNLYYLGTLFSFVGCLLLAWDHLYIGLALFLVGSLVKVCLNLFLTQLFSPDETVQRKIAFMWNYIGMNLGFMLGYLLTGFSTISNNYFYLFLIMSVFVVLALVLTMLFIKEPKLASPVEKSTGIQYTLGLLIFSTLVLVIELLFHRVQQIHALITFSAITAFGFIILYAIKKTEGVEREKIIKFFGFSLLSIGFWTCYMLTPIALMQLIDKDVNRMIWGVNFAPQWLANVEPLVILFFAPTLTIFMKKKVFFKKSLDYFYAGFIFTLCGFLLMALGLFTTSKQIPLFVMLGYLVFLTLGEIFISPASDALLGEYVKEDLRALFTGASRVILCIGALLATSITNSFILPYIGSNGLVRQNIVQLENFFFVGGGLLIILTILIRIIINNKGLFSNKLLCKTSS